MGPGLALALTVALAMAWLAIPVAMPEPAQAQAGSGPAAGTGAAVVSARSEGSWPGSIALKWNARRGGPWWSAGIDLGGLPSEVDGIWAGTAWALGDDTLAQWGVRAGYRIAGPADSQPGPWLGAYVGQQWMMVPFMVEFTSGLRVPLQVPRRVAWETVLGVGLAW